MLNFVLRLYAILLRLYPRGFREEFGDEMQNVFISSITDAAQRGNIVLIHTCLQELLDVLGAILREHWGNSKMAWLNRHERIWRVVIQIFLLVAIAGPWGLDLIDVPAQYACTTAVRLEGDFCGIPVSGAWMPLTVASGLVSMIIELFTGTSTDQIRDLFIGLLMLLPVLPFISTLIMILDRHSRCWQVFHIIALGLAPSFAVFIGTRGFTSFYWWALWGIWLYIGVTAGALGLEVLTFKREK